MKQVSLAELERATADLVYFKFVGSDEASDYFATPDGRHFEVAAAESRMPHRLMPPQMQVHMRQMWRQGGEMALFVKLKEGRWVPPDPDKMEAMFPDTGLGFE
jgi:hypothetical protein